MTRSEARRFVSIVLEGARLELEKNNLGNFIVTQDSGARFSDGEITLKIKLEDLDYRDLNAKRRANRVGGGLELMGKRFNCPTPTGRPRWFEVVDIHPRKPKFPVIAKNLNSGKKFKFSIEQANRYLETR
jgi:hypothetical protein